VFSVVFDVCHPSVGKRAFQVAKLQSFPYRLTWGETLDEKWPTHIPVNFLVTTAAKCESQREYAQAVRRYPGVGSQGSKPVKAPISFIYYGKLTKHLYLVACYLCLVPDLTFKDPAFCSHTLCLRVSYHSNNKWHLFNKAALTSLSILLWRRVVFSVR